MRAFMTINVNCYDMV